MKLSEIWLRSLLCGVSMLAFQLPGAALGNPEGSQVNPTTVTVGNPYLSALNYNGALASNLRSKVYVQGALTATSTETSSSIPDTASNLLYRHA